MRIYRAIWRSISGLVLLLAIGWAMIVLGDPALAYFVVGALLSGFVALILEQDREPDPDPSAPGRPTGTERAMRVLRVAAVGGVVSVGVAALLSALGTAGVLLALLGAATSPPALGLARRHLVEHTSPGPRAAPSATTPATPGTPGTRATRTAPIAAGGAAPAAAGSLDVRGRRSDDLELRRVWRQTFWELREARCAQDKLGIAEARRSCLCEMERRYPEAFATWLSSGPKAWTFPTLPGPGAADQ